jgi:hypothetical protein
MLYTLRSCKLPCCKIFMPSGSATEAIELLLGHFQGTRVFSDTLS